MSYIRKSLLTSTAACLFAPEGKQFVTTKDMDAAKKHQERVKEMYALIESGDLDPNEWYNAFRKSQGRDTTIGDEKLIDIIADLEDDNTDDDKVLLMLQAEEEEDKEDDAEENSDDNNNDGDVTGTQTPAEKFAAKHNESIKDVSITGRALSGKARPKDIEDAMARIASRLNDDSPEAKDMRTKLDETLNAPETVKMGPVHLLIALRTMFPKKGNIDPLMFYPIPFSVEKPDDKHPIKCGTGLDAEGQPTNKPFPDTYKRMAKVAGKSGLSPRTTSAYRILSEDLHAGAEIKKRLVVLDRIENGRPLDNSEWSKYYKSWRTNEVSIEIKRLNNRMTRLIGLMRTAISMHRMFDAIASKLPLLEAKFVRAKQEDKSERLVTVLQPIKIIEREDPENWKAFSCSQFINIEPDAAALAGGSLQDVVDTMSGEANNDGDDNAMWDIDTYRDIQPDYLNYLTNKKVDIYKAINTKNKSEGNEVLSEIYAVYCELGYMLNKYGMPEDTRQVPAGTRLYVANNEAEERESKIDPKHAQG